MHNFIKTQLVMTALGLACGDASAQNEGVQKTYLDTGYYGSGFSIPADKWTAVGPVVDIVCPGTTTCTIEAIHSIQVGGAASPAGNEVQLDFSLDGSFQPVAQQVGEVSTDNSFRVFSAIEVERDIPAGHHTIQTAVWSIDGTYVWNYETNYQVFKP